MIPESPILLIDGPNLLYRSYHSMGHLQHSGADTGAVYGFLSTLLKYMQKYCTNRVAFCWEHHASDRKLLCPTYKMSRKPKTPEEQEIKDKIHLQMGNLYTDILPSMGFCNQFRQPGKEADDILAAIPLYDVLGNYIIVSGDHDLYQCLHNNVMISSDVGSRMTREVFIREYDLMPEDWWIVKALAGCNSDNVEGIRGIGEKTAIDYLNGLLKPSRKKAQLLKEQAQDVLKRNKLLVKLPFPGTQAPEILQDHFDLVYTKDLFSRMGFASFLSQFADWKNAMSGSVDDGVMPF